MVDYTKAREKAIKGLDMLEKRIFDRQIAGKKDVDIALKVLVNSVDGDESQLSDGLRLYAKKRGWSKKAQRAKMEQIRESYRRK